MKPAPKPEPTLASLLDRFSSVSDTRAFLQLTNYLYWLDMKAKEKEKDE